MAHDTTTVLLILERCHTIIFYLIATTTWDQWPNAVPACEELPENLDTDTHPRQGNEQISMRGTRVLNHQNLLSCQFRIFGSSRLRLNRTFAQVVHTLQMLTHCLFWSKYPATMKPTTTGAWSLTGRCQKKASLQGNSRRSMC